MAITKIPQVPTTTLADNFDDHLSDDFNERILFSAPFGSGKSTFLKSYFDHHPEYLVLKLYPVNYSIAQNEDVFELIKYDLLYELLDKYPEEIALNQEQYSSLLISQMYLLHHMKIEQPLKLLLKAVKTFTGSPPIMEEETIDAVTSIFAEFSDYKTKLNTTEFDQLNHFVKSFKNKKGHIHESDSITELIIDLLGRVQVLKGEKQIEATGEAEGDDLEKNLPKTVLLIDDLDRLDPEHVFRLFNIFSAHYDDLNESNKFGFDKVIFVCDVNNIQQMFAHRYGISVEFNGYIDKFYSSEIFKFDITQYLKESIKTLLQARTELLKFYPKNSPNETFINWYQLDRQGGFIRVVEFLLSHMIELGQVKIRNFQRFRLYAIPNQKAIHKNREFDVALYPLLVLIFNLERFFARSIDVENAIEACYKAYPGDYRIAEPGKRRESDYSGQNLIQTCLPFLINIEQMLNQDLEENKPHINPFQNEFGQDIYIHFNVKNDRRYDYTIIQYIKSTLTDVASSDTEEIPQVAQPNPFWFLYKAYQNVKKHKFI